MPGFQSRGAGWSGLGPASAPIRSGRSIYTCTSLSLGAGRCCWLRRAPHHLSSASRGRGLTRHCTHTPYTYPVAQARQGGAAAAARSSGSHGIRGHDGGEPEPLGPVRRPVCVFGVGFDVVGRMCVRVYKGGNVAGCMLLWQAPPCVYMLRVPHLTRGGPQLPNQPLGSKTHALLHVQTPRAPNPHTLRHADHPLLPAG